MGMHYTAMDNPPRRPHGSDDPQAVGAQPPDQEALLRPGGHFQVATQYRRDAMSPHWLDWEHMPPTYKVYRDVPLVPLPPPVGVGIGGRGGEGVPDAVLPDAGLWRSIAQRRSNRDFSGQALSLNDLSILLWASTGITATSGQYLRAAPSAGALYPIETYVVAHHVDGLEQGIYHYRLVGTDERGRVTREGGHALERLHAADMRRLVAAAALDQDIAAECAAVFTWTAVFARSVWKYRQRAYRYVYLDAGHVAQNLLLAATGLDLVACPIAAFYDDEVGQMLGVDGETEAPLYMAAVGRK